MGEIKWPKHLKCHGREPVGIYYKHSYPRSINIFLSFILAKKILIHVWKCVIIDYIFKPRSSIALVLSMASIASLSKSNCLIFSMYVRMPIASSTKFGG